MTARDDALAEIAGLMRLHGLTPNDLRAALTDTKEQKSSGAIGRIFGYIGGIFVFAGLAIFIGMQWDDITPAGRIMLTLGAGFCVFLIAVAIAKDGRMEKAATPLFITAAILQPGGIIVAMKEYSQGGDPAHGLLFMCAVMLAQQGLAFLALNRTFLALTSLFFGASGAAIGFDLLGAPDNVSGLVIGWSLVLLARALAQSAHRAIAGIVYFTGGTLGLWGAWDLLEKTPFELLFLGIACGVIFLSTALQSRALLALGTLGVVGYIGDFTAEHFKDSNAWPLILMFMGAVLIGMGALAVRINRKYISRT